jgi:hypothetical protein
MDGNHQLEIATWLLFLDSQVLSDFGDDLRLTWARTRLLTAAEEEQLAAWWRGETVGTGSARRFLNSCGLHFNEYIDYCRDHHRQPWADERVPLDWFAGWIS